VRHVATDIKTLDSHLNEDKHGIRSYFKGKFTFFPNSISLMICKFNLSVSSAELHNSEGVAGCGQSFL
jgi:hypothetical protein